MVNAEGHTAAEHSQKGPASGASSKTAVAVTGMHRTGTSLVARMLREGGLWFGEDDSFISPAVDNPEGFFEHERLVRLDDELLEATGGAWDHPPVEGPLAIDDPRVAHLSDRARQALSELSGHERWGWKDPRICLTAAFWLDLVPDLRFVLCVRHPVEVAMSLKRRNQISYALGLSLWEEYYSALLGVVPPDRLLVIHFEALFEASTREAERLLDFAEVSPEHRSNVVAAINPELRHQRARVTLSDAGASRTTVELYARICDEAGWGAEVHARRARRPGVHAAVLDLSAAKELAERQGRVISVLEERLKDVVEERDGLAGRIREVEGERDAVLNRVQELEDQRDHLSNQIDSLEKTSLLLGERLAAVENDATASILATVEERVEDLTLGVRHLIDRSVVDQTQDPTVLAGRHAIYEHVPVRSAVLVAGKSDPAFVEVVGRRVTNFPQDASGRYPGFALANSQALLAHLEALRCAGNRFLLIPSSSLWLLEHYSSFGEHLLDRYRVMASDPGFGMLVDITGRRPLASQWPSGMSGVLDRVAAETGRNLAVLDMTQLDVAARVSEYNVFVPSTKGEVLPYLDSTIDVVVVENDDDLPEARRMALEAVVRVRPGPNGLPLVSAVEVLSAPVRKVQHRLAVVIGSDSSSTDWADQLAEVLEEEPSAFLATNSHAFDHADMVVLVDDGVLPLPSCFSEASQLLSSSQGIGAVAVKVVDAYGALEAAGTMVFADGSAMGVGEGSFDVSAAWHEYVRDTCWSPGLMLYRADAVRELLDPNPDPGAQAVWAEHVWRSGRRVLYQPSAVAVRAHRHEADRHAAGADAWSPHLHGRPQRPAIVDEATWRTLLAAEDVAGGLR